ncbi:hypothetical protein D7044_31685 [Micromonospora musae]|uniref:Uncharacterized protein n=1 Tax=Micromonospora musae TaxID=1894970 RepID=A0A3A9Y1P4_9ACTN|nr:hypothetical protein D7044_31685 [Micromonospora musae]
MSGVRGCGDFMDLEWTLGGSRRWPGSLRGDVAPPSYAFAVDRLGFREVGVSGVGGCRDFMELVWTIGRRG